MKSSIYLFVLVLYVVTIHSSHSQVTLRVVGEEQENLSYVNVFMVNEKIGKHTNVEGSINIAKELLGNKVVFSKGGYKDTTVNINSDTEYIVMRKAILAEQDFSNVEGKRVVELGSINGEIWGTKSNRDAPSIQIQYFPGDHSFGYYLDKLKLKTKSRIPVSKVNLRFYVANENGEPGDYISADDVVFSVKIGDRITKVDLRGLKLRMPENGLFIGVEPLIIPENIYRYEERNLITDQVTERMAYMPKFVFIKNEKTTDHQPASFVFTGGSFYKISSSEIALAVKLKLKRP